MSRRGIREAQAAGIGDHERANGWQLGWAQCTGAYHLCCEDSVRHRFLPTNGTADCVAVAVTDGVGGGSRGDVAGGALADHCVTDLPAELLTSLDGLKSWMKLAEPRVQNALRAVSFSPGASTGVAAWLDESGAGWVLRVGDSRAYRITGTTAQALTLDQTYEYVGESPPEGARPGDPARMVGVGCMGELEFLPFKLEADQTLLLCSDGLHRHASEHEIATVLHRPGYSTVDHARTLLSLALANGSHDDITVLLLSRIEKNSAHLDK